MSKQPKHQILSGSSVSTFNSYMLADSIINKVTNNYGGTLDIASASLVIVSASFAANSSSLHATEVIALVDRRLNPDLYRKYQLNYALATGSTYNEAVMWSVNNS